MTESQLKMKVQRYLKNIDAFSMKISDRFSSGIPDMCIVFKGRTIWIELKTPTGVVSAIQDYHIKEINRHCGEAYVVRSLERLKEILHVES